MSEVTKILEEARTVRIEVGDDEVLFIGIDAGTMPPNKAIAYQEKVRDKFREVIPKDVKIITGPKSLDFVVIGKRPAFKAKLDGSAS